MESPITVSVSMTKPESISPALLSRLLASPGRAVEEAGRIYLLLNHLICYCDSTEAGCALMNEMAHPSHENEQNVLLLETAWRRYLLMEDKEARNSLEKDFGIRPQKLRCAILFQPVSGENQAPAGEVLSAVAPLEEGDSLIELSSGETVLLKETNEMTAEDCAEYSRAVIEMAEAEAGISLFAGISGMHILQDLPKSLQEAREAIALGCRFRIRGPVFQFDRQALQRLLTEIPAENRKAWTRSVLPEQVNRLLTEEMTETVQAFFQNDLNLSTTARQLFVHRNTLTYRLDRIRRETGLDLRNFHDAVVFQLAMEMREDKEPG